MGELLHLNVTTKLYGTGTPRQTPPLRVVLRTKAPTARDLIAQHVRAEIDRARTAHAASVALHFLLDDDPNASVDLRTPPTADAEALVAAAIAALAAQRYMLVINGVRVADLDAPLNVSERSTVNFVRLMPPQRRAA